MDTQEQEARRFIVVDRSVRKDVALRGGDSLRYFGQNGWGRTISNAGSFESTDAATGALAVEASDCDEIDLKSPRYRVVPVKTKPSVSAASLAKAIEERDTARAERIGMWRCDCCGAGVEPGELPPTAWMWTSTEWRHKCPTLSPQAGYQSASFFPWTNETVAAVRADHAEALRLERERADALSREVSVARDSTDRWTKKWSDVNEELKALKAASGAPTEPTIVEDAHVAAVQKVGGYDVDISARDAALAADVLDAVRRFHDARRIMPTNKRRRAAARDELMGLVVLETEKLRTIALALRGPR